MANTRAEFDAPDWTKVCDREECERFPNRCDHIPVQHPFVVVTWRQGNAGGESLVFNYTAFEPFTVVTGPSPWGCGSWGPFQADAVIDVRELRADDSWPINGTLGRPKFPGQRFSERWTARDLLRSLKQAANGFSNNNIDRLAAAIAKAEA